MKKIFLLSIFIAVIVPAFAYAESTSTPTSTKTSSTQVNNLGSGPTLDPNKPLTFGLPNAEDPAKNGPPALVYNIYQLALLLGGILAFGSILYGGILYLTQQGSPEAQSAAKSRIRDAIIGLLLLLGIYFILNFIDPNLTKLRFPTLKRLAAEKAETAPTNPGPTSGYLCSDESGKEVSGICFKTENCDGKCTGTQKCTRAPKCDAGIHSGTTGQYGFKGMTPPAGTLTDAAARSQLKTGANITVNKNDCTLPPGADPGTGTCTPSALSCTNCTSLDGIPQSAIDGLLKIAKGCNCSFQVTGGTEAGHKEHGVGKAIVDVEADNSKLNQYIFGITGVTQKIPFQTITGNDSIRYMYENAPPHWHIRF